MSFSNIGFVFVHLIVVFSFVGLIFYLVHRERKKNRYSPFTEPNLRPPGYSLGKEVDAKADDLMSYMMFAAVVSIVFYFTFFDLSLITKVVFALICLALLVCFLVKFTRLFKESRNLRLGYDGEVYTGQELNY